MNTLVSFLQSPIAGPLIGFVLGIIAVVVVLYQTSGDSPNVYWILLMSSGMVGWITGILLTPEAAQVERFSGLGTTIMSLFGGFAAGKVDKELLKKIIKDTNFMTREIVGGTAVVIFGFLLGGSFTYIWRTYM